MKFIKIFILKIFSLTIVSHCNLIQYYTFIGLEFDNDFSYLLVSVKLERPNIKLKWVACEKNGMYNCHVTDYASIK